MSIQTIQEAEMVLQKYVPAVKEITGKQLTLIRMQQLMQHVGNPQNDLKIIHVAGTSGKTSTSYYSAALLQHMGYKVGLTVSPHIDSVTERLQINEAPVSDKDFCKYLEEFLELIKDAPITPTYFEILIALAYWVFNKERVDVAVIETGLGGTLDGSNVATKSDKICVITDIGFDHMHILGNTLGEIATQKAGIIHDKNVVCMYKQAHEVMQSIREQIEKKSADIHIVPIIEYKKENQPAYQQHNFALALYAVNIFLSRENKSCSADAEAAAKKTYIPARMDIKKIGSKKIIFDGAHNQQKMHAFVTSIQQQYPNKKFPILLANKHGKDYKDVINELLPITEQLILTEFAVSQDIASMSQPSESLSQHANTLGIKNKIVTNQQQAFDDLLSQTKGIGLVTGSFYLIAQLRAKGIAPSL